MKLTEFHILKVVGGGRFGTVYKAKHKETGRYFAIKILHKKFSTDERFIGVFHRELMTLVGIKHKNIVKYYDSCFEPPNCYIITEFIEGISLAALLKKRIAMPPVVACTIVVELLKGLDYLHLHDIIHGDLSSSNVLVGSDGRIYLTDLGLAIHDKLERGYFTQGTPGYFSPEHITSHPITKRSDIYCVGIILYELLTGRALFPPTNNKNKIFAYMGDLSFKHIPADDFWQRRRVTKALKGLLEPRETKRIAGCEQVFAQLYPILKSAGVRYTRETILEHFRAARIWYKLNPRSSKKRAASKKHKPAS